MLISLQGSKADLCLCCLFAYTRDKFPHDTTQIHVRPEFFNFSFYRPSRPNFLKIEKKIKEIFFNFIFVFPSDSSQHSTGVQLHTCVFFSFCLFYCSQFDLIKNKIHSDHFPIELKSKETRNCVSFNFNSIGNGLNEFYFYFVHRPKLVVKKNQ